MNHDEVALRLGRLVIASARLELELKQIAGFLGETGAGELSQLRQVKAIRRRASGRADSAEIRAWASSANDLLRQRGALVHGGFLAASNHTKDAPAFISFRRGEVVDIDLGRLDALVESATRLAAEGRGYSSTLFGEFIQLMGGDYIRE